MNQHARLGAFVLAALLLLTFATGKIGDITWSKQENNIVKAEFDDILGLDIQSPVRMAGVKVGVVQEITLHNGKALVSIALNSDVKLPASTRASIIGRGLVGEKNLALTANPDDTEILPDGAIIPSDPAGDINTFITKASGITDDIQSLTSALSSGIGKESKAGLQRMIQDSSLAATEMLALIRENRALLHQSTQSVQKTMKALESELPAILNELHQTSSRINRLVTKHQSDLDSMLSQMPKTIQSTQSFVEKGEKLVDNVNLTFNDNRENLYRTLFELRKASENLEQFSDDIRRNPWKLMKEKPEVAAERRAKQEKMEELLMTTGRMGFAPGQE